MPREIIPEPVTFEWNTGNITKNVEKHSINNEEAEEVFLNDPLVVADETHSKAEKRYHCLGSTDKNKKLFISFTIRNNKIRIISVRVMNKKEKALYAK